MKNYPEEGNADISSVINSAVNPIIGFQRKVPKCKNTVLILVSLYLAGSVLLLLRGAAAFIPMLLADFGGFAVQLIPFIYAILFLVLLGRYREGDSTRKFACVFGIAAIEMLAMMARSYFVYRRYNDGYRLSWQTLLTALAVTAGLLFVAADVGTKCRFIKVSRIIYLLVLAGKVCDAGISIASTYKTHMKIADIAGNFQYLDFIFQLAESIVPLFLSVGILIFLWAGLKPAQKGAAVSVSNN